MVTVGGQVATASFKVMPTTKEIALIKGMEVASVPVPVVANRIGLLRAVSKRGNRQAVAGWRRAGL